MNSLRSRFYRLLVMGLGLGWLLWSLLQPRAPLSWAVVGIFVLLSVGVKRAGFRVAEEVTHSLVNVVDVGALLVLGPVGGAVVASVSSMIHVQISFMRRRAPTWHGFQMVDMALFDGSVKAILALAGGTYYLALGGVLAPRDLDPALLFPLGALFIFWFSLDHLLWVLLFAVTGGRRKAEEFLRRISLVSFIVELAPLPFAIAFAVAWVLFGPLLRGLLLVATVLVALVVRGFAIALARAEARVEMVSLLNKFGQALVLAGMNEEELAALLYEYAAQLLPDASFELVLLGEGDQPRAVLAEGRASRVIPHMDLLLPMMRVRPRGRLLSDLSRLAIVAEGHRNPNERPGQGAALVMPLLAGDELLGLFVAESAPGSTLTLDDGRSLAILATQAAVALQNARRFWQEQWRVRQLATLAEVSRKVASVLKIDDLLWQVVELVRRTFDYYHVQIYLVEPQTGTVVYRAGSGVAGKQLAENPMRLPFGTGIIGWVAEHGEPLLVQDVRQDPRYVPDSLRLLPATRTELAVPLRIEERVLGVLDVQSDQVADLDQDDLFTLNALADQIAVAIEDARLYVAQREAAWVTTALLQVAEALNPLFNLADVLERVTRITPPLVGVDAAVIYLWRSEDNLFMGAAAYGLEPELVRAVLHHRVAPAAFPLLAQVRDAPQLHLIQEVQGSPLVPPVLADRIGRMGLAAVPLLAQGVFVGVLLVAATNGLPRLSDRRRALISGIAQQAAVALQAALLFAAQQEEAAITRDLLHMAERIASHSDLQEVLKLVTRLTVSLAEVNRCAVYLWDNKGDRLLPAEAYGFPPQVESAWREAPLPAGEVPALALLWDATEPVLLGGEGRTPLGCAAFYTLFETESLIAMPLRAHDLFLGLVLVDLQRAPARLTNRLRVVLVGIARQLSIALENASLYEEALENERRSQELMLARQVQAALLPDRAPALEGYDIAGYWRPAREVAGDFYDFLRLSQGRLAFSIADVADKGMGAALFMVLTRTALRESLWTEEEAARALTRTNAIIAEDARSGMFLTAFLGILSPTSGHIQAANAGHLPPLIYRAATDSLSTTIQRNLPMGILPTTQYASLSFALAPGDFLVLITDGLTDITGEGGLFGLHRLSELIYAHRDADARALVNLILDAAMSHAGGEPFEDDLTLVVLRRLPDPDGSDDPAGGVAEEAAGGRVGPLGL